MYEGGDSASLVDTLQCAWWRDHRAECVCRIHPAPLLVLVQQLDLQCSMASDECPPPHGRQTSDGSSNCNLRVGSFEDLFISLFHPCFNALACFMIPTCMLEGCLEPVLILLEVLRACQKLHLASCCCANMNKMTGVTKFDEVPIQKMRSQTAIATLHGMSSR